MDKKYSNILPNTIPSQQFSVQYINLIKYFSINQVYIRSSVYKIQTKDLSFVRET